MNKLVPWYKPPALLVMFLYFLLGCLFSFNFSLTLFYDCEYTIFPFSVWTASPGWCHGGVILPADIEFASCIDLIILQQQPILHFMQ